MKTLYLSIGSNIEPERNLRLCSTALKQHFHSPAWSPVYQSIPIGMDGPDFMNAAVRAQTEDDLPTVLTLLKLIEKSQGRVKQDNALTDRTLDIDLLLFDDQVIDTPAIRLPRPELVNMGFVLVPMVDIAAELIHPESRTSLSDLLDQLKRKTPEQINGLSKMSFTF